MERWWKDTDRTPTGLGSNPNLRRNEHYMSPSLLMSLPDLVQTVEQSVDTLPVYTARGANRIKVWKLGFRRHTLCLPE
jgi:hypothetical protein